MRPSVGALFSLQAFVICISADRSLAAPEPVLTAGNFETLCVGSFRGQASVDPDQLALILAGRAGVAQYLDGANVAGSKNGAIDLVTDGNIPSEPAYAVAKSAVSDPKPFGPSVDDKAVAPAIKALQESVEGMVNEFALRSETSEITRGEVRYLVVDQYGKRLEPDDDRTPDELFGPGRSLLILCGRQPTSEVATKSDEFRPMRVQRSLLEFQRLRLRGAVPDLLISRADLADSKPARISLAKDVKADDETVLLNGVVGYSLPCPDGECEFLPFISYQRIVASGEDNDINALKPGMLGGYRWSSTEFAVGASLEGSYLVDLEQDARVGTATLSVDPAISTPFGPFFGGYLTPLGPLRIRPEARLIGEVGWVFDEGNSDSEYRDVQSLVGVGGEVEVRVRLNYGAPWSDYLLTAGLRNLRLVAGDLDRNDIKQWTAGLKYTPSNYPFVGVGFSFVKGDNPDTLQEEENYSVGVDLRY